MPGFMSRRKERKRQEIFNKAFIEEAKERYTKGEITYQQWIECQRAVNNEDVMWKARRQLMGDSTMLGGIRDWNWEKIRKWIKEYFIPAMNIILPMVIMLLKPKNAPVGRVVVL